VKIQLLEGFLDEEQNIQERKTALKAYTIINDGLIGKLLFLWNLNLFIVNA